MNHQLIWSLWKLTDVSAKYPPAYFQLRHQLWNSMPSRCPIRHWKALQVSKSFSQCLGSASYTGQHPRIYLTLNTVSDSLHLNQCSFIDSIGPTLHLGFMAQLNHLPLDKMATISQTIFSDAFFWMKSFVLEFHWSSFLRVQLTLNQHWFR